MHFISVVVPVFNSADCLPELTRRIHRALQDNYELILVNDHSSDNSWEVICSLFREYKTVAGVNLRINSGQDNALMAGLQQTRGDFVVIMDDDLQHAPEDIFQLYDQCLGGYDVCYADFSKKKQAWWKNLGSWFNGKMGEFILNKPRHIYLSPFKIIRKEVVKEIYRYNGPYPYIDGPGGAIIPGSIVLVAPDRGSLTRIVRLTGRGEYRVDTPAVEQVADICEQAPYLAE